MSDLPTRARRHAATHPESRELIEELLEQIDGVHDVADRLSGTVLRLMAQLDEAQA